MPIVAKPHKLENHQDLMILILSNRNVIFSLCEGGTGRKERGRKGKGETEEGMGWGEGVERGEREGDRRGEEKAAARAREKEKEGGRGKCNIDPRICEPRYVAVRILDDAQRYPQTVSPSSRGVCELYRRVFRKMWSYDHVII